MGVSGVAFRQIPFFSGANSPKPSLSVPPRAVALSVASGEKGRAGLCRSRASRAFGFSNSGFSDEGHLEYYRGRIRCGGKKEKGLGSMKTKKKLKLLKGLLSEDLSMLSGLGSGGETQIGLVGEVRGKLISEAAEVLIKQLEHVREEEKELKRKKKMEKAKLKASRMKESSSSSSSSSSSESEAGEVMDMSSLRRNVLEQPINIGATQNLASPTLLASPPTQETRSTQHDGSTMKRIEVCMGGKCKKSGAGALLEEFERVLGIEGGVAGCKCMGKCKDGPNVRVRNCVDEALLDDSVRTPSNPIFINVGMEDVGLIAAKFLGEEGQKDLGASCNSL